MSLTDRLRNKNFYLEAIKQNKIMVALLVSLLLTVPLFVFTALPPVEVTKKVPTETVQEVEVPVEVPVNVTVEVPVEVNETVQVEVNKTIEVEVNVTQEVVVNTTITTNITEGESIFIESQPIPPAIDSDIVLCIDTSGSMVESRMTMAQTAIHNLVELLNHSVNQGRSNDRIGLVTFASSSGDWTNDYNIRTGLDYVSNQSHLNDVLAETDGLIENGGTDVWAGLNASLDLLLNSPRNSSALQSIILLTDGQHNSGPWYEDVYYDGNYTTFLTQPANEGSYAESPVKVARAQNIKIYSIGLIDGNHPDFDEQFLRNISLHPEYGASGNYFAGNDTLSLTESFLRSRDAASGWTPLLNNETTINGNGTQQLFSFNVTKNIRRLKWDINWDNPALDFNVTAIHPNGTSIPITFNNSENIIADLEQQPKTVILDFPSQGLWRFNISWFNVTPSELLKYRLSTFDPPIFIESIVKDSQTTNNQSIVFNLNITNRNPLYAYHNVTPYVLSNFTGYNVSQTWSTTNIPILEQNSSTSLQYNLTFLDPALLEGTLNFKVNCSEAYYDAYAMPVTLDYREITQNVTVDSYLENQTVTTLENQTITVIENQTISRTEYETQYEVQHQTSYMIEEQIVTEYIYDRQLFNNLKWSGLLISFVLLASLFAVYVKAHEMMLRRLVEKVSARLFASQAAIQSGLENKGLHISAPELDSLLANVDSLDTLGDKIYELTSTSLSPEELIEVVSGTSIAKIAQRMSHVTDLPESQILEMLRGVSTVEELLVKLHLDQEKFLDIVTQDEDVLSFQEQVRTMVTTHSAQQSNIIAYEDIDVDSFLSKMKQVKDNNA